MRARGGGKTDVHRGKERKRERDVATGERLRLRLACAFAQDGDGREFCTGCAPRVRSLLFFVFLFCFCFFVASWRDLGDGGGLSFPEGGKGVGGLTRGDFAGWRKGGAKRCARRVEIEQKFKSGGEVREARWGIWGWRLNRTSGWSWKSGKRKWDRAEKCENGRI